MDTPAIGAGTLATTAILITLGYTVACSVWPFKACRRCTGTGRRRSPSGRAFRECRRCDGTGRRLRAGRRIYNRINQVRRDGTR
ncbi:hypothetical protein [Polymorphospora sp. A560]|uniref:hypothetical protein n=1 Tax=Polymorphospora sp. A560 TaxID=3040203 RepID=UPI0038917F38